MLWACCSRSALFPRRESSPAALPLQDKSPLLRSCTWGRQGAPASNSSGPPSCPYSAECVEEEFSEVRLACMGMRRLCSESIMDSGQRVGPLVWPAAHKREEGV